MSERSRRQRFLGFVPRLSEAQLRRLTAVDHWHHEALVAWWGARPLGIARYVRHEEFDVAEIAVAVTDDWQRLGVGSALVVALGQAARGAGIRRYAATMLDGNRGALRLAERLGRPHVTRVADGIVEMVIG
jgi:GNAT superfamily N-acetyltransferase